MASYKPGSIVRFTYDHKFIDEDTGDKYKEVLVLNPKWMGKLHGIDLKRLTSAEREVLQAVFDPQWKQKPHRLPLVRDILKRMDPLEEVKNPLSFYNKFVRVFLRNKDAYRQYWPTRMSGVTLVKISSVKGSVFNPKPLFHRVGSDSGKEKAKAAGEKKPELTPAEKAKRMELLKKSAIKLFGKKGSDALRMPTRKPTPSTKAAQPTKAKQPTPAAGSPKAKAMAARLASLKKGK